MINHLIFNKNRRGKFLYEVIMHIILIAMVFSIFLLATGGQTNSRGTKQQILEKQIALAIDSAVEGMSFELDRTNIHGTINNLALQNGRVFVSVNGLAFGKGYPYFTKYSVSVDSDANKFYVHIK